MWFRFRMLIGLPLGWFIMVLGLTLLIPGIVTWLFTGVNIDASIFKYGFETMGEVYEWIGSWKVWDGFPGY